MPGTDSSRPTVLPGRSGQAIAAAGLIVVVLGAVLAHASHRRLSPIAPAIPVPHPESDQPERPADRAAESPTDRLVAENARLEAEIARLTDELNAANPVAWRDPFTRETASYRLLGDEWIVSISRTGALEFGRLADGRTREIAHPFERRWGWGAKRRRPRDEFRSRYDPPPVRPHEKLHLPPVARVLELDDEREALIAFAMPARFGDPAPVVRIPLDGAPRGPVVCRRVEVDRLLELGRVDVLDAEPDEASLRVHLVSPTGPTDSVIRVEPFDGRLVRVFASPDGARLVVASRKTDGKARLVRAFDTRTRELLWQYSVEGDPVGVAWRSDGSTWIVESAGDWESETRVHVLDPGGERRIPAIEDVGLVHSRPIVIVPLLECIVVGRRVHELPPVLAHLWPNGRACERFFPSRTFPSLFDDLATVRLDDQGMDYIRPKDGRLFVSKRYGFVPR